MNLNKFPKAREEHEQVSPVSQELLDLVGGEPPESVANALHELKRCIDEAPKTGRSISMQANEFVIPLLSSEHKQRVLSALEGLNIYPWEEKGEIIIDHHRDLAKLAAAGIILKPKETLNEAATIASENRGSSSYEYSFPFPSTTPLSELLKPVKNNTGENINRRMPLKSKSEDDGLTPEDISTELQRVIDRFDQELIDNDDSEFISSIGYMPTLKLFPQQYIYIKGKCIEKRTGKEVTHQEQNTIYQKAKEGDARAMNQAVRMHLGLVIDRTVRMSQRMGGNPDDLFQEGMIGLMRAISLYDSSKGAFSTYAIQRIESIMRVYNFENRLDVHRPINVPGKISKIRKETDKSTEEGVVDTSKFFKHNPDLLHTQSGITRNGKRVRITPDGVGLDRLERLYLMNAVFDPLSNEEDNPIDAGRGVEIENELDEGIRLQALKDELNTALLTLTPREEQVIRRRFGLGNVGEETLEEVGESDGVSYERIRQIEAKALRKLRHPSRRQALRMLLNN